MVEQEARSFKKTGCLVSLLEFGSMFNFFFEYVIIVNFYSDPFFNKKWLSEIPSYDQEHNWRLKANNLRKIYRRLTEYYTDHLGATLAPKWYIDTSRIGKVICLQIIFV